MSHKYTIEEMLKVLEAVPGHIYWEDLNGVIVGCNEAQAKFAGFNSPEEMIGKTDHDLPWNNDAEKIAEINRQVLINGETVHVQEEITLPDGKSVIFLSKKCPHYDKAGNIVGLIGVSVDITELVQTKNSLKKALVAAEAANKAKKQFIESMSHDLRTPLSGMIGMAEIMTLDPSLMNIEHIQDFHESSKRLLALFNQVLDYISSEEPGHLGVEEPFAMSKVMADLQRLFKPTESLSQVPIHYSVADTVPGVVFGYGSAIHRIILNLISNATKFTKAGEITVNVDYVATDAAHGMLTVSVADTGIGIPDDAKQKIFERFERVKPSYETNTLGAGLGLSIIKRTVADLNGKIHFDSEEGKGSTFTCDIPVTLPEGVVPDELTEYVTQAQTMERAATTTAEVTVTAKAAPPETTKSAADLRFLVVEDNPLAAKVVVMMVEGLGYAIDHVTCGEDALVKVTQHDYDFIFMDIGLPGIDGVETTRRLRESYSMPIVALTGHADIDIKGTGLTDLLTKPLSFDKAEIMFAKYLNAGPAYDEPIDDNVIHLTQAAEQFNGDKHMAAGVLKEFVNDIPKHIATLTALAEQGNKGHLLNELNSLKGTASYCGLIRFQEAIVVAYDKVMGADSSSETNVILGKLFKELQRVVDAYVERYGPTGR